MTDSFTVDDDGEGLALEILLQRRYPDASRGKIRRMISRGEVRVNTLPPDSRAAVGAGDYIEVDFSDDEPAPPPKPAWSGPPPAIAWRCPSCLVLAKPSGLGTTPDRGTEVWPLRDWLVAELNRGQPSVTVLPDFVHRLDKETSGALVVATDVDASRSLCEQFREGTVRKEYLALVTGAVAGERGTVDAPLLEHTGQTTVSSRGREAFTDWQVEERFGGFTLLRVSPRTGRQHQIRVHLAHFGHPLAVDRLYGQGKGLFLSGIKRNFRASGRHDERPLIGRVTLHAQRVTFQPPGEPGPVTVEVALPADFELALKQLRKWARR